MKSVTTWKLALLTCSGILLSACQNGNEPKSESKTEEAAAKQEIKLESKTAAGLETEDSKVSYAIGVGMGEGMSNNLKTLDGTGIKIDTQIIAEAFADGLKGTPKLEKAELEEVMKSFQERMKVAMEAKQKEEQAKAAAKTKENLASGADYLKENGTKEGVTTLESGLQYKVLTAGTGKKPVAADRVKVHYSGTLTDGTKFDSSYDRNAPATFGVTQVIAGWTEALQLMTEGAKWQLTIPSDLAYGPNGRPGTIPGNAVLLFDVELLEVIATPKKEDPAPAESADK